MNSTLRTLPFPLWEPEFRAFCIGLPKTGTTSIARIFRRYRSDHEVRFAETVTRIEDSQKGRMSGEAFRRFVVNRVTENGFEMDSSSFNHYYLETLVEEFPEARFVLTVRDFKSWINSYLNMLLRWRQSIPLGCRVPEWQLAYGRCQFGEFDPEDFVSIKRLKVNLREIAGRFFECWAGSYTRIFHVMDRTRTLILETGRISSDMDAIARFMGIPANSLDPSASHSNRGTGQTVLTDFLGPGYVEQLWVPKEVQTLFSLVHGLPP